MYSWFFDSSILVSYLSIRDGVVIILSKSRRLNWISLYFRILLSSNRSFLSFVSSLVNIFVDHWSPLSAHSTEIDIVDDDQTERRFFKLRRAYSACRASTFQPLRVNGRCSFSLFFFFFARPENVLAILQFRGQLSRVIPWSISSVRPILNFNDRLRDNPRPDYNPY